MDTLDAGDAQHALELAGIVAFALSGATLAIRKGFDVVGIVLLALLTALGGGVIRDLLIGATPPAAFRDLELLVLPVVAALVAMVAHPLINRAFRVVLLLDAAGLALFSVTGTLLASEAGLDPVQAAFLGVVTCVGGGVLRDVVARETPVLVRADSDLYAVPAALGAGLVSTLENLGAYTPTAGLLAASAVFLLRVAAMAFDWRAPVARQPAATPRARRPLRRRPGRQPRRGR
ncbi:trimeric intracellular cation channel family protein [Motilibacter aurantiacus]|uniref:trimeric intracellular cation channel family protein n=1 Tax=Motilibacter aurantiacus TaxID=2714955 RepID=UPI00140A0483|nr:trimeric intracellular cation channel family protein [Motilibacter aurantiacus]